MGRPFDIADWLRGLSLERYAEAFRANAIEVEVLPELSEADLEKLGVLLGHRKMMLRAIAAHPDAARPTSLPSPVERPAVGENVQRRIIIQANVAGRDLGGVIGDVRQAIAARVTLPPGYFIQYGGQFEAQERATQQIALLSAVATEPPSSWITSRSSRPST